MREIGGETHVVCEARGVVTSTPLALYLLFVEQSGNLRELEAELIQHHRATRPAESQARPAAFAHARSRY